MIFMRMYRSSSFAFGFLRAGFLQLPALGSGEWTDDGTLQLARLGDGGGGLRRELCGGALVAATVDGSDGKIVAEGSEAVVAELCLYEQRRYEVLGEADINGPLVGGVDVVAEAAAEVVGAFRRSRTYKP